MKRRRPPLAGILPRASHAPSLVRLYVGDGWAAELTKATAELERDDDTTPAIGMSPYADPARFWWPVVGRNVLIYGRLAAPRLQRLMAALLRDGAAAVAGLDADGVLHTACRAPAEAAA